MTHLDTHDISEIYQARKVLELAGNESSRNASASELGGLQHAVDGMREAAENDGVFAFVQADSHVAKPSVASNCRDATAIGTSARQFDSLPRSSA
ncbi:hypothetical protein AAGW05_14255 [Arthrobacter sp. LAPM80]|uniref:hypothetical protein n=1 Tax=Arthrobacter sp. LAPM80 TaxID=3141788 RepID=UPI00398A88EE